VAERVDTEQVRALAREGAVLIEVLPRDAYEAEHLPGALSIPLEELNRDAVAELDPTRPTVTYCYDYQCDLSARAARRLETLGFDRVYDYTASKVAWFAEGLPTAGRIRDERRAGAVARPVPTCSLSDTVAELAQPMADHDRTVVTDDSGVVLGLVRREVLGLPPGTAVERVMQLAPPTVRPSIQVDELADSMERDGRSYVLVSHLDGTLVGLIERADLDGRH
jgi:rhodanese-related sulfurtransferase